MNISLLPFHCFLYWHTAALEKELWSVATINIQILKTINVIFSNFPKLHVSEAATLCIPHLIVALKSGSEAAQDSALNSLCLFKDSWSTMSVDISNSQATVAAEAIPVLQMLLKTCPPSFHERADNLLHGLPGCLTVTVERANNLRQVMGGTNAFCRLMIGNGPPQQTKVFLSLIRFLFNVLISMSICHYIKYVCCLIFQNLYRTLYLMSLLMSGNLQQHLSRMEPGI